MRKPVFGVSDQVRHKTGCTVTEDARLEARNFGFIKKRDCDIRVAEGADQLRVYREADLRLFFRICKKPVFS